MVEAASGKSNILAPHFWIPGTSTKKNLLHPESQVRVRRDPELWNVAADIVMNGIIDVHPQLRSPEEALRDRWICEPKKSITFLTSFWLRRYLWRGVPRN